MKDAFQSKAIVARIARKIKKEANGLEEKRLMEVCGSHTQAIERYGLRKLLPKNIVLVSGPGCPVCITPASTISEAIYLAKKGIAVTTFGDLAKVPCKAGSLLDAKAQGADVRIVYSIAQAGEYAFREPKKNFVHIGVGFETTAQTTAAYLSSSPPENFLVLNSHRRFLPAMQALLESGETKIDGYICPGHVSALTGSKAYLPLSEKFGIPQVVAGFEPVDVMLSILLLVRMLKSGKAEVKNEYSRVVKPKGNKIALSLMDKVFGQGDANWRGLGVFKKTGMPFKGAYLRFDARYALSPKAGKEEDMPKGCSCASVLKGIISPKKCPLFGKACTPEKPIGPCMISVEGACHNAFWFC
jgi:hydrogenase expression/formation protein HypD